MAMEASEAVLKTAILRFLKLQYPRGKWFVVSTTGVWDGDKKQYRKTASEKGVSDILGCIDGKFIAIEVKKNKTAKRSKEQKQFIDDICEAKGSANFAWNFEMAREIVEKALLNDF